MKYRSFLLVINVLCMFSCGSKKIESNVRHKLNYTINNNQFYFNEQLIPAGCFAQLMTALNGDNIQAAIYLERNSYRGCLAANLPYPSTDKSKLSYTINKHLSNHTYQIIITKKVEGSLDKSIDKIIIQFVEKEYILANGNVKKVLSIDKKGDW